MDEHLTVANTPKRMDVSETYRLVYPFKRLNTELQQLIVEIAEQVMPIKEEIENYSLFDSFDAIMYSLRYLGENGLVDFSRAKFVDCMSFCGAASFYAASYQVSTILGIEFNKQAFGKAEEIKKSLFFNLPTSSYVHFEHGSFQDFFPFDADIVYMDCTQLGPDSMIDEGVLLHSMLFPLCKKLLSGSFLIIVTSHMTLHTADCAKLGVQWECVSHKPVDLQNENYTAAYKDSYPKHVWILKTSNYKHK